METKKVNQKLLNDLLNEDENNKGYDKQQQIKQLEDEVNSESFDLKNDELKLTKLNKLFQEIKIHIDYNYQKLGAIYNKVFPEIFSILPNSVLVAKAVIALGDFKNIDEKKLQNFDQKILMNLLMSAMNKNLDELTVQQKEELFKRANDIIVYSQKQQQYLQVIQKLILKIAPNTAKIAGNLITAQLVAQVGGIQNLANIPSCNIQVIGEKQKKLNGLSKVDIVSHVGFFDQHFLFKKTEVQYRKKLVRFLSNGVAKASKIDAGGYSQDGEIGQKMYKDIIKKINNIIGPKKRERIKPMKAPGTEIKRRRGGKKYRKMKLTQEITEVKKLKNRLEFGTNFKTDIIEEEKEIGMLKSITGRKLKIQKKKQKFGIKKNLQNSFQNKFEKNKHFSKVQQLIKKKYNYKFILQKESQLIFVFLISIIKLVIIIIIFSLRNL